MSKMLEDLVEVVSLFGCANLEDVKSACFKLVGMYHATITQNAEDSKRLNALEQAIAEIDPSMLQDLSERADEIMRGDSNDLIRN